MKPNFRKQLEEVLINYRDKRFSLDYKVKRPTVNEITNQILALIKKELPKKKDPIATSLVTLRSERNGYNQAIDEMGNKLK